MYSVGRRTKRWPLCLFFNFLDVVAINSAVIYKAVKQDGGMARKDFIKQLALQLMRDALNMRNQAKYLSRDLQRFKEGREETADNERSGRPSTSTTPEKDKVLELVLEDRRITVREVAEEARISFGSTQSIMKDILGVRRLNAILVLKDLTFDQKNARKELASLNLEATTDYPELLKRASEWRFKNDQRPKKARKAPSKVKVMLTVFFDYQDIVHHEF
ncbi:hypothetical protein LAZ67_2001215 [Cordylochernes scorpioides]|uniref:Uncharacterized protein n=1 Tax=Cordylochernes scorpioides TaxID=51811 RepID=A0ABY6K151_9ARAC|nr:hypothetical protein LAZ67_2001215 [Cordylochernes scorpioides]